MISDTEEVKRIKRVQAEVEYLERKIKQLNRLNNETEQELETIINSLRNLPWEEAIKMSVRVLRLYADTKYYKAELKWCKQRIQEIKS